MIKFTKDDSGKKGMLNIEGNLTIEHAAELKSSLIEAIGKSSQILIDFKNITDLDLSCLQLLWSVHKISEKRKGWIRVDNTCPEVFKKTIEDAGYPCLSGLVCDSSDLCHTGGSE